MIAFDWVFFAVGIPAIIFGGIAKGGFGSGAAFVAGAILALVVPPGLALGIILPLFMLVDADVFRLLIGAICLAFAAFQLARALGWLMVRQMPFSRNFAWVAGLVGGFTSFISHAGGPPTAIFLLSQGLGKTAFQATTVLSFWAINWMKVVPYAYLGIFSLETLKASAVLAPFALIGAWIGVRAHRLVPERAFFALTYVLLVATGLRLIWVALA